MVLQRINPAELLRLYLDYDLLSEAADLAIEYIRATLGAGKEYFGLTVSSESILLLSPQLTVEMIANYIFLFKFH